MQAIIVDNDWVYIDGVIGSIEPLLVDWFSVRHPKIRFIDTSQQSWDGWYRKYDERRSRIAKPLLAELKKFAIHHGLPLEVVDKRDKPRVDPYYYDTMLAGATLAEYQMDTLKVIHPKYNECGIISVVTGGGKCFGINTPILMYDGTIKLVQDINIGDIIMGDDSNPRKVISICNGVEQLYAVKQEYGDKYIVNESHILSLKNGSKIIDIEVKDYLNLPQTKKVKFKGFKVPITFDSKNVNFDPYVFGSLICKDDNNNKTYKDIKSVFPKLIGARFIPDEFKFNSKTIRSSVLAGIIDSSGDIEYSDVCSLLIDSKQLAADIVYISRSIGLKAISKIIQKGLYRIVISGKVLELPLKVKPKRILKRKKKDKDLSYDISVDPIGIGQYYGFELEGDKKRFLLGDFTVAHNTELMAAVTKAFGLPTTIIADQRIVIEQIKERLELRDVVNHKSGIGLFYGGSRPDGQTVVVGSIQSLTSPPISLKKKDFAQWKKREENAKIFQDIVSSSGLLLVDEVDKAVDNRYRKLFMKYYKGRFKYGFSGTPFDKDKPVEALILKEHIGSIIHEVPRSVVQDAGRIIPIKAFMIGIGDGSQKHDRTAYDIAQQELILINPNYHDAVKKIVDAFPNDRTMILVDTNNVECLGHALENTIPGSVFIYNKSGTKKRKQTIKDFENGKLKCLIGGKILKRGLDLKGGVHNLIICGGGKLHSDFDQKIGRAVRKNDKGFARVFCFFHLDNYYLYKHSKAQLTSIIDMGYEVKVIVNGKSIDGVDLVNKKFRFPK